MLGDRVVSTVLIVDDDEATRTLYARWANVLGYSVLVAADAAIAEHLLRTRKVHVVVSDIVMPGHDGVWLIDKVTREHPGVPVIVVTGLGELTPAVTLRPGVEDYLVKPFPFDEFRLSLERVLAARHGPGPQSLPDPPRASPRQG